jgi:mycoredoxin
MTFQRKLTTCRLEASMLTMYSTSWCGYCHRLGSQLDREGIGYTVVDIEKDRAAAEFVMSVNGGNQTVPTVRFPDGSALTNPSIVEVKQRLAAGSR